MANSKKEVPATEETLIEKVGHKIGNIKDAVVEKYNDLVHPDEKKRLKKAHQRPVAKKDPAKKVPAKRAADPKEEKKAAVKKAVTAAAKKPAAKKVPKGK